jgi:phosphate acetyltransferase
VDFIASVLARAAKQRRRIVLPESADERVREAARALKESGVVEPVLVGPRDTAIPGIEHVDVADVALHKRVRALLLERRRSKGMTEDEADELSHSPLLVANGLVKWREAHGCVAGSVLTTGEVVRGALWMIGTAPGVRTLSSSFYMTVPAFRGTESETLTFTDCAVVVDPTAEQLADIAYSAAADRRRIVGDEPLVAFLSYSTKGSAAGTSVEKVQAAMARLRVMAPELAVDGELQGDAALIETVASRKARGSAVAGRANILVFPDLDAGNIAYKLVQRLASARAIGPVLQGLEHPCNDLSRGASAEDIFNVAALTALQAGESAATRTNRFRQETT